MSNKEVGCDKNIVDPTPITDWSRFESNTPYKTQYRRTGEYVEVRGVWHNNQYYTNYLEARAARSEVPPFDHRFVRIPGLELVEEEITQPPTGELLVNPLNGRYYFRVSWEISAKVVGWTNYAVSVGDSGNYALTWTVPQSGWYLLGDSGKEIFLKAGTILRAAQDSCEFENGTVRNSSEE